MKLLLELKDKDIGEKAKRGRLEVREAARAVALRHGKIAFINVSSNCYHKLPGGGIEHGENIREALRREMLEETGCKIKITDEVGKIIERRTRIGILQTSYCFIAEVLKVGKPNPDEGEMKAGYRTEWVTLDKAVKVLEKEKPNAKEWAELYMGKFIVKRDLAFINAAKRILAK